jgi:hypothetical protein
MIPPLHRVVNVAGRSCDSCGKFLYDCACPVGVHCIHCDSEPEDVSPGEACEYSSTGEHDWRDEDGARVIDLMDALVESLRRVG